MCFFSELNSGSCSGRQPVPELVKKSFAIDFFVLDSMMNHTVNKQVIGTRLRIVMKNNTLFISEQIKWELLSWTGEVGKIKNRIRRLKKVRT